MASAWRRLYATATATVSAASAPATGAAKGGRKRTTGPALVQLPTAIQLVKATARARFDETVELAVGCKLDKGETLRGVVILPRSSGKELRLWVIAKGKAAEEAVVAGANRVGADDVIQEILKGNLDFDRCIATPEMMPAVAKVARILGPRGLMPNLKTGTVTDAVGPAVRNAKFAKEFRADKTGIVHAGVGKVSFDDASLEANVRSMLLGIKGGRMGEKKGKFIHYAFLSSTMGKGVPFDISSIIDDDKKAL